MEVYCEGPETLVERFIRAIDRKGDPADPFQLNVEAVEELEKPEEGFPSKRFAYPFALDYDGEQLSSFEAETMERSEMAILVMSQMNTNLGDKIDVINEDLGCKMDRMNEDLGTKTEKMNKDLDSKMDVMHQDTNSLHQDINQRFDWLGEKYGEFGQKMSRMEEDIHEIKDAFIRLVDHFVDRKERS